MSAAALPRRAPVVAADLPHRARQSWRFLVLYALAVAGGAVAYVPFLTLLLPLQAGRLAGDQGFSLLAYAAFAGAVTASLANLGFGWLSDHTRTRRPWIAAGLVSSSAMLVAMPLAQSTAQLIAMIVVWQLCLNMMLGPLFALAGDYVPDEQKGLLGGLLGIAPALGALSGALVTIPGFAAADQRYGLVAGLVVLLVGPLLLAGKPVPMPHLLAVDQTVSGKPSPVKPAMQMWLARLLVQIAEAALFAFLLLWFRSLDPRFADHTAATLLTAVLALAAVITLLAGRWSDSAQQPILPLTLGAGSAAVGLITMAVATDVATAIAGYVLFGLSASAFLALHSSQTLRVLPRPATRGRDLGLFNLTNTVPSLVMPGLTLALVPRYGFGTLFLLLAGLSALACVILLRLSRRV